MNYYEDGTEHREGEEEEEEEEKPVGRLGDEEEVDIVTVTSPCQCG
jgi:hypothetical protein